MERIIHQSTSFPSAVFYVRFEQKNRARPSVTFGSSAIFT